MDQQQHHRETSSTSSSSAAVRTPLALDEIRTKAKWRVIPNGVEASIKSNSSNKSPEDNGSTNRQEEEKDEEENEQVQEEEDYYCTNCTRYILFKHIRGGQGTGQAMNGLLAAHLLGDEFNRVVCVTSTFGSFHRAFVPLDHRAVHDCPTLKLQRGRVKNALLLINYQSPPDECMMQKELASDKQIVYVIGNTYPRWPTVPNSYFTRFYVPSTSLQRTLPWNITSPPTTVVHLRKGDRMTRDVRAGLDFATLKALCVALSSSSSEHTPFLVTNNVDWFNFFANAKECQWRHSNWRAVRHSAFKAFLWGKQPKRQEDEDDDKDLTEEVQDMQMFSDWYTILRAQRVWHTHSDFSLSAIHWMDIEESKTIMGVDEAKNGTTMLKLVDEPWRRDELALPLKDRGPNELANCRAVYDKNLNLVTPGTK